uniref:Transposase n=1 Tax=Macrostomum lignano TaxID=282301 RepID=A0A1I8FSL9_9PLAT
MFSRCSYFQNLASEPEANRCQLLQEILYFVQMSMWLLNRYYSAYSLLFRAGLFLFSTARHSISPCRCNRIVERDSHVIRRMIGSKMTDADVETMCSHLDEVLP